jgi:hypothetical protein
MKTHSLAFVAALGVSALASPAAAQLAAPNATGAAIGHIHINATNLDAQVKFWTAAGGTLVQREKLTIVRFPGIFVLLRKQDNTGGTVGSSINHVGFSVRDFEGSVAKWKAAGLTWEPDEIRPTDRDFSSRPTTSASRFSKTDRRRNR